MPANEREVGVTAKLQEAEAVKVDEFKYPGSTIKSNRQERWRGERKQAGEGGVQKVYEMVVRSVFM